MKLTADDLKKCLNECISEIVFHHNEFSLVPKAFSRTRKWPLDKLIHFILSFGSQSLGTEILVYFQFQDGFSIFFCSTTKEAVLSSYGESL